MSQSTPDPGLIVRITPMASRRGLFGWLGAGRAEAALPQVGCDLLIVLPGPDGAREILPIGPAKSLSEYSGARAAALASVRVAPNPLEWAFSTTVTDESRHRWDLTLVGSWTVKEAKKLLETYALSVVSPAVPLSLQLADSWLANLIQHRVGDAVRSQTIEDLRDRDALPVVWWEKRLCEWLGPHGITARVNGVRWQSADAARAAAERQRIDDLQAMEKERDRQLQAELSETQARAKYEMDKRRIEDNLHLSESERSHKLEMLERQRHAELLTAEMQLEESRRACERAALDHEIAMARRRNDLEMAGKAQERRADADQQHREELERLSKARATLEKLATLSEPILQRLAAGDFREAHQAAERLTSPEFKVSPEALNSLGYSTDRQSLVSTFRQCAAAGQAVSLRMVQLATRDVGTVKVKSLPIDSSLEFQFTSRRAGYVTVLNIGTSGSLYLHVPNAYVGPSAARAAADRACAIPGRELLPIERLAAQGLDYIEAGPAGWEHLAVIISDQPLVRVEMLAGTAEDSPFVKLSQEEFAMIAARLDEEMATWAVGLLSFLVG